MKSLINENVEHITFGKGLIIEEEIGKITVEFHNQVGNKRFQFPDAFEQYLRFEESSLQAESLTMIESKKQKLEDEKEKRRLELARLNEEERVLEELDRKKKYKRTTKKKVTNVVKKTADDMSVYDDFDE